MVGRDGKGKYFAHPDEPIWQQVSGVAVAAAAVKSAEPEWRRGAFAAVTPVRQHRGVLVVPEAALQKPKSLSRKRSPQMKTMPGLSWGDYAYYEENPSAKAFAIAKGKAEGVPLEGFHDPFNALRAAAARGSTRKSK